MSHKIKVILTGCALVLVVGCASNPSVSSLTSLERQRVAETVIFEAGSIPRNSYRILGPVEGIACKRNLYASGSPSHWMKPSKAFASAQLN
ncbi:MAG: hypothetical protein RBS58_06490 [Syntrophales bacterium]|jgi:hypothetical protein|nr:hypothetical protein [Syntrophales bacterium]MDX9922287.1 hypothetical protein [Syntrophales bacterium]